MPLAQTEEEARAQVKCLVERCLVDELYGLTDKEIQIVLEETNKKPGF